MATPKKVRLPTLKQIKTAEGVLQGKSLRRAALDAGYAPSSANTMPYQPLVNSSILGLIGNRREQIRRHAQIHTDVIVGALAEIATASLADVLEPDGTFDLAKCCARGTDHLLKKLIVTERHSKDGSKRVTTTFEMYSRLDALDQLRATFGMTQEPRPNTFDNTKRTEVERSLARIRERDGVSQRAAAQLLLKELGDSQLAEIVSEYVN